MALRELLQRIDAEFEALQAQRDQATEENLQLRRRLSNLEAEQQGCIESSATDAVQKADSECLATDDVPLPVPASVGVPCLPLDIVQAPAPPTRLRSDAVHFAAPSFFDLRAVLAGSFDSNSSASSRASTVREFSKEGYAPVPSLEVEEHGATGESEIHFHQNKYVDMVVCGMVLLNALWIGLETEYMANNWSNDETPVVFKYADAVFCLFFTAEIVLRLYEMGVAEFFTDKQTRLWNIFDLALVSMQIFDSLNELVRSMYVEGLKEIQALRVLRLLRIVRLVRVLSFFAELRSLCVSIMAAVKQLGWLLLLIAGMTYFFGVILTQFVTMEKRFGALEDKEERRILDESFGSLMKSMLVLFECVTEGRHWGELVEPLAHYCSEWWNVAFVAYMAFMIFAVLNVVTATLVDSTLQIGLEDKQRHMSKNLFMVFEEYDLITRDVFEAHFEHPQMKDFLEVIKLEGERAQECDLFGIIDSDGSGTVSSAELISGCVRLSGTARAFELESLAYIFRKRMDAADQKMDALISAIIANGEARNGQRPTSFGSSLEFRM